VTLPNGLVVEATNDREALFLYGELFETDVYLKHGLSIDDGDCVFDVGANVGLFSASLAQRHRDLWLVLFEPVPETFAMLERNAERLLGGARVTLVQAGVSSAAGRATFEVDPNWSIAAAASPYVHEIEASSRASRRKAGRLAWDRAAVAAGERIGVIAPQGARRLNAALDNRLLRPFAFATIWALLAVGRITRRRTTRRVECELTTVSAAMREHGIDRIDLLKIDAEGAELPVLEGIDEDDWPRIRQVTLEAHGEELADRVRALLEGKGFDVSVEEDDPSVSVVMGFRMLYARR
jgi:FkbM family methyltransferase